MVKVIIFVALLTSSVAYSDELTECQESLMICSTLNITHPEDKVDDAIRISNLIRQGKYEVAQKELDFIIDSQTLAIYPLNDENGVFNDLKSRIKRHRNEHPSASEFKQEEVQSALSTFEVIERPRSNTTAEQIRARIKELREPYE